MVHWFEQGEVLADYPASQRDKDDWAGLLVIRPDKTIQMYERTPHPVNYDEQVFACGCGRDFAMGALLCGRDAKGAVEVAIELDHQCGNGVTVLTLGDS
jgi:hypothetical protein